jgi:radical SAM superfamily enzyme YgiQ (UPF0313 family)
MARVLLVNSNLMKPPIGPIGLDYIAAYLDAMGHEVELLDLCFEDDWEAAIRARLSRGPEPQIIGVTLRNTDDCYCASRQSFLPQVARMVRALQAHAGDALVVIGGVGFSLMPQAILMEFSSAAGIIGDGEVALAGIANAADRGENLSDVPGLIARTPQGEWRIQAPAHGALPKIPPARSFVDNRRYFREGGQAGIESKRGCAGRCIYCADPVAKGRAYRLRPPADIADEAQNLVAQGVDCFHTCDSEFNLPPEHALAVCEEFIRRGLGERLRWYAYCSPGAMTRELAVAMRRAGCVGINFGTDSGCDAMLERLGRDFKRDAVRGAGEACRAAGITYMCDLLLGGPGETRETADETIRFMQEIGPDAVGVAIGLRIYPGTELARIVAQQGLGCDNPNLVGETCDNGDLGRPVFYLSAALGRDYADELHERLRDDPRFFLGGSRDETDYNYNANQMLVEAIKAGARGAYWDILRRLRMGGGG